MIILIMKNNIFLTDFFVFQIKTITNWFSINYNNTSLEDGLINYIIIKDCAAERYSDFIINIIFVLKKMHYIHKCLSLILISGI